MSWFKRIIRNSAYENYTEFHNKFSTAVFSEIELLHKKISIIEKDLEKLKASILLEE